MQLKEFNILPFGWEKAHSPGGRAVADIEKFKILVVDDGLLIAFSTGSFLREGGYNVHWTVSSSEALSLIREKSFDIVISDVFMRPVDGIELIRELRKCDWNCRVLMMSATVEQATTEERMRELDVSAFPGKPFDFGLAVSNSGGDDE